MVKYETRVFTKHHAWTSYNKLSPEQDKAIQNSCYDELPNSIETYLGVVQLYNKWGDFSPIIEAYENPGKIWKYNKKSDWYTHISTGLKVKKEIIKSPNYDRPNGHGSCTTTLTVKIPLPSERGKNPNSHHNKPKMADNIAKDINLTPEQWEKVAMFGDGKGYSQGVRNLLDQVNRLDAV